VSADVGKQQIQLIGSSASMGYVVGDHGAKSVK
jgi:hypothetical protein